jgi:alpha-galactosidase
MRMTRRAFLDLAAYGALAPVGVALAAPPAAKPKTGSGRLTLEMVRAAPGRVVPVDAKAPGAKGLKLVRTWDGERCRSRVTNPGKKPVRVREVILFSIKHDLAPDTRLYGESLQMLSQTGGTLGQPVNLGYDEQKHYKVPQPEDATAVSSLLGLTPPGGEPLVLAFSSSKRFVGRFYLRPGSIDVVMDAEGLALEAGKSWELEELVFATGPVRAALLASLADRIAVHHPPLRAPKPPTGWCSWYCFGPRVTAHDVLANLDAIAKEVPGLTYVQLDDGYQPAMGDWLETGKAFGGNVQGVLKQIRGRGFEPAIWVAPFIAEAESHLFKEHPDWFMKGEDGKPLPSSQVTFGGWRRGPWYALDGTHPEVQEHLEKLFHTMRSDWGCTYFKLDANFWGAMHGGKLHDPQATRVEAYRRGMQAILRGAGDSFILGCNHPIWASFGLIHGSRSSGDVKRNWATFQKITRQNLSRNWQNGRLWWNDSDAVVLTGDLSEDEYQFHATAVYASGGLILSGDDLTKMPPKRLAMLRKLLPPHATAAAFVDETLEVGAVELPDARAVCLFNFGDEKKTLAAKLPAPCRVTDYWSGVELGKREGTLEIADMPPHSARLLLCRPVQA